MNKKKRLVLIFCLSFLVTNVFGQYSQKREGFGEALISTKDNEFGVTFNSKMNEIYFTRAIGKWGREKLKSSIYHSKKIKGVWTKPKLVSFSGKYNDSAPHLTKDGKKLYFISNRPNELKETSADIWVVEKNKSGDWSKPKNLGKNINSNKSEYSPRTTKNGDLYFASSRDGGFGQGDIYFAKREKDGFAEVVNLGEKINSPKGEWNLEVNEDGSIIIFEASERKENRSPYGDLYISFKKKNEWTIPQNIKEINTTGSDLYPLLSKNNEYLYFSSTNFLRSVSANVYRIKFRNLLKKYKRNSKI